MTRASLAALSTALLLAGCIQEDPLGGAPPATDSGPGLVPATAFLEPGATLQLDVTPALAAGGTLSWESSAPSVVSVSGSGSISAIMAGTATIEAHNPRGRGRSVVTVLPPVAPVRSWRVASLGLSDASLLGLWCVTPQIGFAVGTHGTILRTTDAGLSWSLMSTPDSTDLVGVWGSSPSDVYAVGAGGVILHFDGAVWTRMSSPATATLLEVWGLAPDDIYAVGAGTALHFDGSGWHLLSGAENAELWAVWGPDASHIFAAGQNGVLLRLDGSHWTRLQSPTQLLLLGLWGTAPDNIYAVGIQGTVLHWDGAQWSPVAVPTHADLFAVWGRSGAEILAVGNEGSMLLFTGSAWTLLPQTASGENLRAVHAASTGGFMAAGWSGTLLRRNPTGDWSVGATAPLLFDLAPGPGGTSYAVGGNGAVLRDDPNAAGWSPLAIPRNRTFYGAATDGGDLLVVGDAGTILRYRGPAWTDESIPARLLLRSIWLAPDGQGFVVGEQGLILRRSSGVWQQTAPVTSRFLRHVWGLTASNAYAVGDSGTVLHWDGAHWDAMSVPTDSLLRGVWGSGPADVFAVGAGGVILRFDGVRWYAMPSPTTRELRAVWGSGPTDVYAAGEAGTVLRFDGAHWTRMTVPISLLLLGFEDGVTPTPRLVGMQGVVLEGER